MAAVNLGERSNCCEVFRRDAEHVLELVTRLVVPLELEKRSAEGDARGKVGRVPLKARPAGRDRSLELSRSPILLRERCESDRRRVQLDPAFQIFDSSAVGHAGIGECDCGPPAAVYHS
jgi:hypothetical protein